MKLNLHTTKVKPSKANAPLLDEVGIEETIITDVSHFQLNEEGVGVFYNNSPYEFIPFRGNDGQNNEDWRGISIFVTRELLKVDMTK